MPRPRMLDLFCGAGGAAMGYHRAGFDVVGVDIRPQPHYPFEFIQADALDVLTTVGGMFDAIHASPPCQAYSIATKRWADTQSAHPSLVPVTAIALACFNTPWVMENVPGSPLRADLTLCGAMFGLPNLVRHRVFELSGFVAEQPLHVAHDPIVYSVAGHPGGSSKRDGRRLGSLAEWRRAMGIDWMNGRELNQAIPPAYTEYIGRQLYAQVDGSDSQSAA